ncbi:MAG TPA: DUF5939 domain-containing protein [Candidatus Xenobia bacterium]|jgi:class 3 adenylate cyclase
MTQLDTFAPALAHRLRILEGASNLPSPLVEQFGGWLSSAADEDLFRASPLQYAELHHIDRGLAVDLFLHATHAGILEFNWGVLCPICGAYITTEEGLRSLGKTRFCALCRVDVEPLMDANIEITFGVSPTIRPLQYHDLNAISTPMDFFHVYFSPSRVFPPGFADMMAHLLIGFATCPGGDSEMHMTVREGGHTLLAPMRHLSIDLQVSPDGTDTPSVSFLHGQAVPQHLHVAPGPITLRIHNGAHLPVLVMAIRHPDELPPLSLREYLGAPELVTNQTFRDLFRTHSLPAPGGLQFKGLAFLFTDLKGSTEMYDRIGDFRAYDLVREHFSLLYQIVAEHRGAIVKTIGDAIMATFQDPAAALRAAVAMHGQIGGIGHDGDLGLKIGLHSGPSIAVESNEHLDYFGQTVNIAARVQGLASAAEIYCTDAVYQAPQVQSIIDQAALAVQREEAQLKGVGNAVTVYRLSHP